jgi:hypothetical protein
MSKTNDTVRELRDDELENVSGGACCNGQHLSEIVVTKPTDVASWSWGMTQTGTS